MNNELIERNKLRKKIYDSTNIIECFCYDKDQCAGKIINAHTLQENGILNLIEEKVGKNNLIYSLGHFDKSQESLLEKLKPVGKKITSVFTGFCQKHDNDIFKPIEDGNDFNIDNNEHSFLQSYRNFARFYYRYIQAKKIYENEEYQNKVLKTKEIDKLIPYLDIKEKVQNLDQIKIKLNRVLTIKDFSKLEYSTYKLDRKVKIATSSIFFIPNSNKSFIAISVFPKGNKTMIILATLREDEKAINYLKKIELVDQSDKFYTILSFLMLNTSTLFAPSIWHNIEINEKKNILEILTNNEMMIAKQKLLFSSDFEMYNFFKN